MQHITLRGPFRRRRSALVTALIAVVGVAAAGCGAGQDTQTGNQQAAVGGNSAQVDGIELLNVYFRADPTDTGQARYGQVTLAFTVINTSDTADRLESIDATADASLTLEGPDEARVIRPGTSMSAGQPIEQLEPATAPDQPITVRVDMPDDAVRPGLTHPVTFTFERAGSVTLQVPFDAWTPTESVPTARPLPPLPAHP
ncbi:hypothetical protein [Rhodococcus sp. NPDC058521]|uniref:hypothetical protein n=1 Tax=Rhodococcus sp. NPDC058521 TaxID=3346536 RepID=UPI00364AB565